MVVFYGMTTIDHLMRVVDATWVIKQTITAAIAFTAQQHESFRPLVTVMGHSLFGLKMLTAS
jgi:steroid 5-alpha reductase family enzyme